MPILGCNFVSISQAHKNVADLSPANMLSPITLNS